MTRCEWAEEPPLVRSYHDTEWGTPLYDDRKLFEFLLLDGMQAGLSWLTILKKREHFRRAFDGFDPEQIARYGAAKKRRLLQDAGIIRNRLKIEAAVANAQAFLRVREARGAFHRYLWDLVGGQPVAHRPWRRWKEIPAHTGESRRMSRALIADGFRFVGPTICYAFMQAAGMTNDHVVGCFRYRQVQRRDADSTRPSMVQSRCSPNGLNPAV